MSAHWLAVEAGERPGLTKAEREELVKLRRENRVLRMERDLLARTCGRSRLQAAGRKRASDRRPLVGAGKRAGRMRTVRTRIASCCLASACLVVAGACRTGDTSEADSRRPEVTTTTFAPQEDRAEPSVPDSVNYTVVSMRVGLGESGSYGMVFLENPERQDLRIIDVRIHQRSAGLSELGAVVIPPREPPPDGTSVGQVGFPPSDDRAVPAAGYVANAQLFADPAVAPRVQVVVGFRVDEPGRQALFGIDVEYEVGGEARHERYPFGMVVCADESDPCQFTDGDEALRAAGIDTSLARG